MVESNGKDLVFMIFSTETANGINRGIKEESENFMIRSKKSLSVLRARSLSSGSVIAGMSEKAQGHAEERVDAQRD